MFFISNITNLIYSLTKLVVVQLKNLEILFILD